MCNLEWNSLHHWKQRFHLRFQDPQTCRQTCLPSVTGLYLNAYLHRISWSRFGTHTHTPTHTHTHSHMNSHWKLHPVIIHLEKKNIPSAQTLSLDLHHLFIRFICISTLKSQELDLVFLPMYCQICPCERLARACVLLQSVRANGDKKKQRVRSPVRRPGCCGVLKPTRLFHHLSAFIKEEQSEMQNVSDKPPAE